MSGEDPVNLEEIMETNPGTMALIQTGGLMKGMVEEIPEAQDMDHLIAAIGTGAMTGGTMIGTGTATGETRIVIGGKKLKMKFHHGLEMMMQNVAATRMI
jgi:hypothetical protein